MPTSKLVKDFFQSATQIQNESHKLYLTLPFITENLDCDKKRWSELYNIEKFRTGYINYRKG